MLMNFHVYQFIDSWYCMLLVLKAIRIKLFKQKNQNKSVKFNKLYYKKILMGIIAILSIFCSNLYGEKEKEK